MCKTKDASPNDTRRAVGYTRRKSRVDFIINIIRLKLTNPFFMLAFNARQTKNGE